MAETTPDDDFHRGRAEELRLVFREYKKLNDLPPVERIGWIAGFSITEDEQVNENMQKQTRTAIQRQDWQALVKIRKWELTEDDLSYFAVQCNGHITCIIEVDDRYDFIFRDRILWHHRCNPDQTKYILPLVCNWQYLVNPAPNPSLFSRFLDFINWH